MIMGRIGNSLVLAAVLTCLSGNAVAQWFDDFKPLADIYSRLDEFQADYPDLVESFSIGTSYEGREIRGIRISGTGSDRAVRPGVLLNGTQHAREWISPMTNMYAADQLLSRYDTDAGIRQMLDSVEFYVIPVVNPDGYAYSWADPGNRLWRKNRRPTGPGTFGVDLNRNWDYGWGLDSGSSASRYSNTYRGTAPFSEPETAAMRDFYQDNQNLVSNIDFHAYSQLVLYPFGYSELEEPADVGLMSGLAADMSASIQDVHGEFYNPVPASDLYLASGVSIDWSYGNQNVYSYTVELRPKSSNPGFELPATQIQPTVEEAFAAVLELGNFTAAIASGDFDNNSELNCSDIDSLYDAILNGTEKYEFDVSGDGVVDGGDVGEWLEKAGTGNGGAPYLPGDANMDGTVDTADFDIWNEYRFTATSSFCKGDFNADGVTDMSDLHIWNEYKFQSGTSIPEPTSWVLFGMGLFVLRLRKGLVRSLFPSGSR